ncbi:MAG: hypothetical protein ACLGQX_06780 [Acidobacteriota bacterium]
MELNQKQLEAARALAWKQTLAAPAGSLPDGVERGEALLTLEAARDWINEFGLVLFAPRAQQLPAPAPSLVEATLGAARANPTPEESEAARGLVARMAGEGLALPLNLLGMPGDTPDFIVSARIFSYVFTMRGDKAWKHPPSTSGAVRVSPLGLRVFEALTRGGAMTAAELAQELGREVTESAVVRALGELWSQLRVIPLPAQMPEAKGDGATLWELTTRRFTKAIKTGANSGQPSALSALVSLYLTQVFAATEEEIATFLSPLTARSRVREVLHALVAARQLNTVVIEGKTLLHLPGGLPEVASAPVEQPGEAVSAIREKMVTDQRKWPKTGTGRKPRVRNEVAERSQGQRGSRRDAAGSAGDRHGRTAKPYGSGTEGKRPQGRSEAARRPFQRTPPFSRDNTKRPLTGGAERRSFTKPWEEERRAGGERRGQRTPLDGAAPEWKSARPKGAKPDAGPPAGRSPGKRPFPGQGEGKRAYSTKGSRDGERAAFKPRRFEGAAHSKAPFAGEGRGRTGGKPEWAPRDRSPRGGGGAERRYDPRGGKARGEHGSAEFVEAPGSRPAGNFQGKPARGFPDRPASKFAGKSKGKPTGKLTGKSAGKFGGKPGGKFAGKAAGKPGGKFKGKSAGKFGAGPASKPKFGESPRLTSTKIKRSGSPGAARRKAPEGGE